MSNLMSMLLGSKGESKIEDLESTKQFCTGLFKNGLWERRKTDLGYFTHQLNNIEIPYLTKTCTPKFEMSLPKMPIGIYNEILRFFLQIYGSVKSEVIVQVFWNLTTKKYELYVPVQKVAGASIVLERNLGPMIDPNMAWIADIHSHNVMGAGFSGTDTNDEKSTRLFGVIGTITTKPTSAWRAGCNQKFVTLQMIDIFDSESTEVFAIDPEAIKNVTEFRPAVVISYPPLGNRIQSQATVRDAHGRIISPHVKYPVTGVPISPERYPKGDFDYMAYLDYLSDVDESADEWAKPIYYDAVTDFIKTFKAWVSSVNDGDDSQAINRQLISDFCDMISECDMMEQDFIEDVINELSLHASSREWIDIVKHASDLGGF